MCVQHLLLLLGIQLKQVLRWDKRFLCPNGSAYHFWPKTEVVHSWDTGDVTEEPLTAGVLTFFLALWVSLGSRHQSEGAGVCWEACKYTAMIALVLWELPKEKCCTGWAGFPKGRQTLLPAYLIFPCSTWGQKRDPPQLWGTKAFAHTHALGVWPTLWHGGCLPEITSLGKRVAMTLLSVSGVRIAAVFPSMLPMPSISSMTK